MNLRDRCAEIQIIKDNMTGKSKGYGNLVALLVLSSFAWSCRHILQGETVECLGRGDL